MSGRQTTADRRTTRWARPSIIGLLFASIVLVPSAASAQTADCAALRARIEVAGRSPQAGGSDVALCQSRTEYDRLRAYADDSGCNGGSLFDDADSPECHALLEREDRLRQTIERLSTQGPQGGGDDERRAAIEDYNATCTGGGSDAALPTPDAVVPVDPDAPAGPSPSPAPVDRIARVYCVRHCDGAYYPLAVDVPKDKLGGMDQLCQAQCPNAQASAFSDVDGNVAKAQAADGSTYDALPAAFQFQKTTSATCSCRGPGESWAQTLAKAETMIEAHNGDVIVTPEIQARMDVPLSAPEAKPGAAKPKPSKATPKRAKGASPKTPPTADAATPNPGEDLTRAFRQSVPTL